MNNNNNNNQQTDDTRYLGKIKQQNFQKSDGSGSFQKFTIMLDNPSPANEDGTPNQFHKGVLIWFDAETGEKYQVKQIDVAGVSNND